MNNELQNFLKSLTGNSESSFSEYELSTTYPNVYKYFQDLQFIKQSQSASYAECENCGMEHKVFVIDDKFCITCTSDESVGIIQVSRSKVIKYKFSLVELGKWLNKMMDLDDNPYIINDTHLVYLGRKNIKGTYAHFYLDNSSSFEELQKQISAINKDNKIILSFLDSHIGFKQEAILSIYDFIDRKDSGLTFNAVLLNEKLEVSEAAQGEDIILDNDIVIHIESSKYSLRLNKQNGKYLNRENISPQMYFILNWFYQQRHYQKRSFKGSELQGKPFLKNARTLSTVANQLNQITEKYHLKPIIHKFPNSEYGLNPDLDSCKKNSL